MRPQTIREREADDRSGKVRVIAVVIRKRIEDFPYVPT